MTYIFYYNSILIVLTFKIQNKIIMNIIKIMKYKFYKISLLYNQVYRGEYKHCELG